MPEQLVMTAWLRGCPRSSSSILPGSGVVETVRREVRFAGGRHVATNTVYRWCRRGLALGTAPPARERSFIWNLAPSSPQVFELGPLFEGDAVW